MSDSTILAQLENDVPLHAIRIDGGTQPRTEIHEATVAEYAEAMRQGVNLPPLVLFFDGAELWLADGFHRYHACLQVGLVATGAEIHSGTRRDAVLYAVGANAAHGLRRSNADKRRAVQMLLEDTEWVQWSDREIARQCGVGAPLVADVRKAICNPITDSPDDTTKQPAAPATRTVTRNGTVYQQKVKKTPDADVKPSNSTELAPPAVRTEFASGADTPKNTPNADETTPTVATPGPTPEQAAAAVTRVDELLAENAALREELDDIRADLRELLDENEDLGRIVEADDRLKAAMAEVARYKALAENAERTLAARSNEFNERARNVTYWKNRAEKAEKMLGKVA